MLQPSAVREPLKMFMKAKEEETCWEFLLHSVSHLRDMYLLEVIHFFSTVHTDI